MLTRSSRTGAYGAKRMDAVKFLKEQYRMCEALNSHCKECGLSYVNNKTDHVCGDFIKKHPEEAVAIVEKWGKEHPIKTRQSEFLKMFPDAQIFKEILTINPCAIDSSRFCTEECHAYDDNNAGCFECRKKYWTEEIE